MWGLNPTIPASLPEFSSRWWEPKDLPDFGACARVSILILSAVPYSGVLNLWDVGEIPHMLLIRNRTISQTSFSRPDQGKADSNRTRHWGHKRQSRTVALTAKTMIYLGSHDKALYRTYRQATKNGFGS